MSIEIINKILEYTRKLDDISFLEQFSTSDSNGGNLINKDFLSFNLIILLNNKINDNVKVICKREMGIIYIHMYIDNKILKIDTEYNSSQDLYEKVEELFTYLSKRFNQCVNDRYKILINLLQ